MLSWIKQYKESGDRLESLYPKDRTVTLNGRLFEVPVALIGQRVDRLYHATRPRKVEVFLANCYPADFLRMIRNQIPIERVIVSMLHLEVRRTSKWLRFRCPLCHGFHTATNRHTNLARCFDCKENFNPIDMVMAVGKCTFL